MKAIASFAVSVSISAALTGCFTGVESTPKITSGDVKRENVRMTEEQKWLADVRPEPFREWKPGKPFYVTDNKITLALNPIYTKIAPLEKATIRYKGYRDVLAVTGETATELLFDSPDGVELTYRIDMSPQTLLERNWIEVPFTIEWSVINETARQITGKHLWVLTEGWYDILDQAIQGRKFVPVTITGVLPGNTVYPVTLEFSPDSHPDIKFHLFMSVGNTSHLMRSFATLFSFTDPRTKYPAITDDNWRLITDGRIAPGMTRDECRLALGAPKDVDRQSGYSSVHERWTYENGIYLIFEDGLLVRFRR